LFVYKSQAYGCVSVTKSQFAADSLLIVLAMILAVCTFGTISAIIQAGLLYAQLVGATGAIASLVISACMALIAAASYPRPKMSTSWSRGVQGLARVSMSAGAVLVILSVGVCVFSWVVMSGAKIFYAPNLSLFVLLCIAMVLAMIIAHQLRTRSNQTTVPTRRQIRVRRAEAPEKSSPQAAAVRTQRR